MRHSSTTDILAGWFGFDKALDMLLDAGYTGIDCSLFSHDFAYLEGDGWRDLTKKYREKVESRGAIFNQAHAPFGGGFEHYTTVVVPVLPRVFKYVAALGVPTIVVHPLQNGRYYGHEKELFEANLRFYRSLAPHAKEAGVRIAIENMWQSHPVTGYIVDDVCAPPEELAAIFDELNDPETFTICLDLGHTAICGREPQDCIRKLGADRMGTMHAHDVDYRNDCHTLPGTLRINWDAVCQALADIGYRGDFTLEADNFFHGFGRDFAMTACRFMAERAKFLADTVVRLRDSGEKVAQ